MSRKESPPLTEAQLDELSELLRSENPSLKTIKAAVAAVAPKRSPKPKKPPADPSITRIKRMATQVSTLSERIQNARRTIQEVNAEIARKVAAGIPRSSIGDGFELVSLHAGLPGWQNELTRQAGDLALAVRSYFKCEPTTTPCGDDPP